jgi:hypothetical protein
MSFDIFNTKRLAAQRARIEALESKLSFERLAVHDRDLTIQSSKTAIKGLEEANSRLYKATYELEGQLGQMKEREELLALELTSATRAHSEAEDGKKQLAVTIGYLKSDLFLKSDELEAEKKSKAAVEKLLAESIVQGAKLTDENNTLRKQNEQLALSLDEADNELELKAEIDAAAALRQKKLRPHVVEKSKPKKPTKKVRK